MNGQLSGTSNVQWGWVITAAAAAMMGLAVGYQTATIRMQEALDKEKLEREKERCGRIRVQQRARDQLVHEKLTQGFTFKPIATVSSPFKDRRGTPRQPILVPAARGKILFDRNTIQHAHFAELKEFSHIWVVFVFHQNTNVDKENDSDHNTGVTPAKIKPPRLGGKKVGCLSTRSPHRPNPIGLSVFEVVEVGVDYIEVSGIDLCDGTPVLDVKPYIPYDVVLLDGNSEAAVNLPMSVHSKGSLYHPKQLPRRLQVPNWIVDSDIQLNPVSFEKHALDALEDIIIDRQLVHCTTVEDAMELITQVLRQDIRGVHQGRGNLATEKDRETTNLEYMCRLDNMDVRFITTTSEILVTSIALIVHDKIKK